MEPSRTERQKQLSKGITFSILTLQEENQLYTLDIHYEGEGIEAQSSSW